MLEDDRARGHSPSRTVDAAAEARLESLVARCLGAVEERGEAAIDDVCREHPEDADALRRALAPLRAAGLLRRATAPAPPPLRLGEFEIRREIGRGAMGVVYEAVQTSLARPVALKVLPAHLTLSPVAIERFRREASLAAKLEHRSIVEIYSVGEESGTYYFAMELVRGTPLDKLIERIRATPFGKAGGSGSRIGTPTSAWDRSHVATVVRLVADVADALQHAHANGVVHRDVKPSNVILREDGTPVVTDFGLARGLGLPSVTMTGDFAGTPHYVSPEQALATEREVDGRSDVFSLGVTLYELLTLRKPFEGRTVADVLQKIVSKSPVAPSKLNPEIARDLETICLTAMEKSPEKRYASAGELAADLRRFLELRPVKARPVGWATRTGRWARRNPLVAGLGLAVAALLVTVAVGASISAVTFRDQRDSTRESLRESLLQRARSARWSGRVGRRRDALAAIVEAARIRPGPELRDEAIASLALVDLEPIGSLSKDQELGVGIDLEVERAATSDESGTITIRSIREGAELLRIPGPGYPAWILQFDDTGRRLLAKFHPHSMESRSEFRVVDATTGETLMDLGVEPGARLADLARDGRSIAVGYQSGVVELRAVDGDRAARTRFTLESFPIGVRFDPTGRFLACAVNGRSDVRIVDAGTGDTVRRVSIPSPASHPAWSGDGLTLAVPCRDGNLYVDRSGTGDAPVVVRAHESGASRAALDAHGTLLASLGWDEFLRLSDPGTGRPLVSLPAIFGDLRVSPDGRRVGFSGHSKNVEAWEIVGRDVRRVVHEHASSRQRPWAADFSPDGRLLASASDDGVRLFDPRSGTELAVVLSEPTRAVAFRPDGRSLFTSGRGGLREWPVRVVPEAGEAIVGPPRAIAIGGDGGSLALTADGNTIAVANARGVVHTLDLTRADAATPIERARGGGSWLALSTDARFVAVGEVDSLEHDRCGVFDLAAPGKAAKEFPPEYAPVAFSPDGRSLLLGDSTGYVVVEVPSLAIRRTIPIARPTRQPPIAFSRDGRTLAILADRDVIALYDAATLERFATLTEPERLAIGALAFSADGATLVAADGTLRALVLWDLRLVRERLSSMGLDWDAPPFPAPDPDSREPLRVRVVGE